MTLSQNTSSPVTISDKIVSAVLDNGIRIFILPSQRSASVSVQAWIKTGSIHEEEFLGCGLSHFLEHMAFNGTNGENGYTKLNVGDSFKKIENFNLNSIKKYRYSRFALSTWSDH